MGAQACSQATRKVMLRMVAESFEAGDPEVVEAMRRRLGGRVRSMVEPLMAFGTGHMHAAVVYFEEAGLDQSQIVMMLCSLLGIEFSQDVLDGPDMAGLEVAGSC